MVTINRHPDVTNHYPESQYKILENINPAKHTLSQMKSYNGYFGCSVCESAGELVGRYVRLMWGNSVAKIRNAELTLDHIWAGLPKEFRASPQ